MNAMVVIKNYKEGKCVSIKTEDVASAIYEAIVFAASHDYSAWFEFHDTDYGPLYFGGSNKGTFFLLNE